jgi:hypothetical protein
LDACILAKRNSLRMINANNNHSESQKIIEFLLQGSVGVLFAALGFFAKLLTDYIYLKAPRLKLDVKIRATGCGPPANGYRVYGYLANINIYNHSGNVAYDFELQSFRISSEFKVRDPNLTILKNPITDQQPLYIEIEYYCQLEVTEKYKTDDGRLRLADINKEFTLKYSYSNALGKKYSKIFEGIMTKANTKNSFVS